VISVIPKTLFFRSAKGQWLSPGILPALFRGNFAFSISFLQYSNFNFNNSNYYF